ncbi:MAG TPA: class I SAM-dependent methyltransferase [Gaiellaceae bacterium]|nr:class I SAM-dependent methyltransferase [Gaiellaceae bacterium]
MLDERVRSVLERLEREDAGERDRDLPAAVRARQVARTTGQFLFALVAPQTDCEVLEIGGSRGYSTIWLAAGVRQLGGRVLSLENDPAKTEAWRRNIADAGLQDWAELVEGDAFETLARIEDVFDIVFLDAEKDDYERLFSLARPKLEPGGPRRRRQRHLAPGPARALLRRAPGGPDALERHRSTRPRPRAERRPPLI